MGIETSTTAKIDTANKYLVARSRDGLTLLRPPLRGAPMTDEEALNLAAWLVAMVDRGADRFEAVYVAIANS